MKPKTKSIYRVICLILAAMFVIPAIVSMFMYN